MPASVKSSRSPLFPSCSRIRASVSHFPHSRLPTARHFQIGDMKPNVIIFSGYGLNTEDETRAAFEQVGATADIIHLNDVMARSAVLMPVETPRAASTLT